MGAGRTELLECIAGRLPATGGRILLEGGDISRLSIAERISRGLVLVPEDRKVNGFFETMGIDENIYLGRVATPKYRRLRISRKERQAVAQRFVEGLRVRTINTEAKGIELSGGNQQKVVIAKSLVQDPSIVIFDEPTRGVDVGTIPEIHAQIRALADEGKAVVVISSYLPEVLSISDRILVARLGRIVAEFDAAAATEEKIMYAAIH